MSSYMTRAMKANDRRYAKILGKLGHAAPEKAAADDKPAPVKRGRGRPRKKTVETTVEAE